MPEKFEFGPWYIEFSGTDGGRIERLCYRGDAVLKTKSENFVLPSKNYGQYETRPVFGYDDCFPSCVACPYPDSEINIPDHGEICWLNWDVLKGNNYLSFIVKSKVIPVLFKREMIFNAKSIKWNFSVYNEGRHILPFQHVMHPLVNLDDIKMVKFPASKTVLDFENNTELELTDPNDLAQYLFAKPAGTATMLFLQDISNGEMSWTYKNGQTLEVRFPHEYFPTIGIWWNNSGHPNEEGLARNECAFEPTPGSISSLKDAYSKNTCLFVNPRSLFEWRILWNMA